MGATVEGARNDAVVLGRDFENAIVKIGKRGLHLPHVGAERVEAFQFGAQGAAKFDVGREQFVGFVEIPGIPHFIEETADKNFVLFQWIIERCESITNADRSPLENFRAKTGAVHHRSFDADLSERLEIRTGLAQTFAPKKPAMQRPPPSK